jgi:hypothetical protein
VRSTLVLLLLLACGKPCPYVCESDGDCAAFYTCYQHETCLQQCDNIVCNGACVDSFHNCLGCGFQCAAGQVCGRTGCEAACETGLTSCSGSCRDLQTDRASCGACGHICAGNETCASGVCRAIQSCG